jgi:hypothetical protein
MAHRLPLQKELHPTVDHQMVRSRTHQQTVPHQPLLRRLPARPNRR